MSEETNYPAPTAAALAMMQADSSRVMDAKRRLSESAQDARRLVGAAKASLESVMGRGPGGNGYPVGVTKGQINDAEAKVTEAEAESHRRQAMVRAHEEENKTSSWAMQRSNRYLLDLGEKPLLPHRGSVLPKRRGNETYLAAVTRVRGDIKSLKSELTAIADRPLTAKEAKAAVRAQVERLADSNPPDVTPLLTGAPMKLPVADIRQSRSGPRIALDVPDAMGLLAWTFRDALVAKLESAIDAAADDDKQSMTAAAKATETARLANDILAAERVEEALIEAAHAEGQFIERRPDVDPRAVLWLSAEMPVAA